MVPFTAALVAAAAAAMAVGAMAVPADPQRGSATYNLAKRTTPNSSGCSDGFWYQFWDQGGGGQVTYTNKAAGEYSVTWNSCQDFTSGKGWRNVTGRTIKYAGSFSPGSNSYLAVYTWSQHGETYILENYGGYNPGTSGGQHKGTFTSDGGTYDIYRVDRGGGYIQFWSIRQGKRSSGIVTTKNHYDKYNSLGLTFDPAKNATYQILSTEGYQSTGSADMTVAEIVVGSDGTTSTIVPTCTEDSRDKPLGGTISTRSSPQSTRTAPPETKVATPGTTSAPAVSASQTP